MAGKEIIWSVRANSELKENLEFYNKRNGNVIYSLKLLLRIDNILNTLSKNEFIGRLTENKKTRVLIMDRFLVFYEINNERIEIVSFWDNRQDETGRIEY